MSDLPPYIIGIDLGTTNSALAYVQTDKRLNPTLSARSLPISQLTAPGYVESKPVLPSFLYLAAPYEFPRGTLQLPWKDEELLSAVGFLAREHGARVPNRLVQSAKSWLSYAAAHRRDRILPCEADPGVGKVSPVEASASYLRHLREAWNYSVAKGDPALEFDEQAVIITVPASFDEVARALTVEAAKLAGLRHFTLLEEPQAAFYSWIMDHEREGYRQLKRGETILVCDIGGGTTDFSLIQVLENGEQLSFQRMAVGNHLLLGGDNMDIAIAHLLERRLREQGIQELDTTQWLQLKHQSRAAKEALLSAEDPSASFVLLEGKGSRVVGGSCRLELQKHDQSFLVGGASWKCGVE